MKLIPQTIPNTCQIIAIQHTLAFFNIHIPFNKIKKELPHHDFGDLIQEIGIYLDKQGIKTTLISNHDQNKTKLFQQKLNRYKNLEKFQNKTPKPSDIKNKPIIINVDANKIQNQKGKPSPHYVVILKEKGIIYMYDGWNFKRKVKRTFNQIYNYSLSINSSNENGMWLIAK